MRTLASFRETLGPEGAELQICPPDCTVDHDAKWRDEQPTKSPVQKPGRKEAIMASKSAPSNVAAIAEGFELSVAKAYAGVKVEGKGTIARLYQRSSGAVALYISGSALEGLPKSVTTKLAETRDGEASFTVAVGDDGAPIASQVKFAQGLLTRLAK